MPKGVRNGSRPLNYNIISPSRPLGPGDLGLVLLYLCDLRGRGVYLELDYGGDRGAEVIGWVRGDTALAQYNTTQTPL